MQTFLEEACIRLPTSIAAECKSFVDTNIDYILNILIQEVDPQAVCSLLSICPGGRNYFTSLLLTTSIIFIIGESYFFSSELTIDTMVPGHDLENSLR